MSDSTAPTLDRQPAQPPAAPVRWPAGRIVTLLAGLTAATLGALLLLAGLGAVGVDRVGRDSAGFLTTDPVTLSTDTHALASDTLDVEVDSGVGYPRSVLGDVRFRVTSTDPATPIFVGMARAADVEAFLDGSRYATVLDVGDGDTRYLTHPGSAAPGRPADQTFWTLRAVGTGTQTLTWTPEDGDWTIVAMRADAAPGLTVRTDAGVDAPVLTWIAVAFTVAGGLLLVAAAPLVILPLRRAAVSRPISRK